MIEIHPISYKHFAKEARLLEIRRILVSFFGLGSERHSCRNQSSSKNLELELFWKFDFCRNYHRRDKGTHLHEHRKIR